jgi:hypothetical protein
MAEECIPRSSFVPITREESLRNDCEVPEGGTPTVRSPDYVLTVKNPDETSE